MDEDLHQAAVTGNLTVLRQAVAAISHSGSAEYLLCQTKDGEEENIIHRAIENGQEVFVREALNRDLLPPLLVLQLICQRNSHGSNPLHTAAGKGHLQITETLVQSYRRSMTATSKEPPPAATPEGAESVVVTVVAEVSEAEESGGGANQAPWLVQNRYAYTPLHLAILNGHEEVALYMLSLDLELLSQVVDHDGRSPLYLAVKNGLERVTVEILTSGHPYSLGDGGYSNRSLLHEASRMTEKVAMLLLEKHPELFYRKDRHGDTFLLDWVMRGELPSMQCLLKDNVLSTWKAAYKNLLCVTNNFRENAIHYAARCGNTEIARILIDAYVKVDDERIMRQRQSSIPSLVTSVEGQTSIQRPIHHLPWLQQNIRGETPLHIALDKRQENFALYLLAFDSNLANIPTFNKKSPLFLAVERGCEEVALEILRRGGRGKVDSGPNGQNPMHVAFNCPGIAGMLMEMGGQYWIESKDEDGKAPLDVAAKVGHMDMIDMAISYSGMRSAPYAWIGACEGGQVEVIRLFMDRCGLLYLCRDQNDTPLHHIQLKSHKEYQDFLEIPLIGELKNTTDLDGATPLHRALERKDMILVEVLLNTKGIDWTIRDKKGETALDLLAKLCNEFQEWDVMCKRIGINPRIKTTYIPLRTNLAEMRSTLSVIAALLATITFAAGFTIPGGFNNNNGNALLAKKAAFIVFLLSDTYAMCCSMLVLFCLLWAMVWDSDRSLVLVDRSVFILQQSLYGTLVAFMAGVYTVVSHTSLWTAIVVCVMCSLVPISANKTVLYKLLDRFIPAAR